MTIEALMTQLALYRDYRYSTMNPHYPSAIPGVRLAQGPPKLTNCCTFVEGLVLPVAAQHVVGLDWGLGRHSQMMITGRDILSPVAALVEAELADRVDPEVTPPAWSVVQGWRSPERGHTFIIAETTHDGKVLILEANRSYGLDGVGWRGVGNLRDAGADIPEQWWERVGWSWDRVRSTYRHALAACALMVG